MDVRALKAEIVRNGYTQDEFCKEIGMAHSTFIRKLKQGVFKTDEAEKITLTLNIADPAKIFFDTN